MDQNCFIHPAIYVGTTERKGRGLFTSQALATDIVIENSPVLVMDEEARIHLDKTLLHDYIFEWQPNGKMLCCMAMGYLPLYNHSYASNCEYYMDYDLQTMCIKTVREIEEGEELSINYNGDWDDEKLVWFESVN